MKPREKKNRDKIREKRKGKQRVIKNKIKKGEKAIKCEVKKAERAGKKIHKRSIKRKELKIKIMTHELLVFTLSYLMPAPW
jgi:hypothetical protein